MNKSIDTNIDNEIEECWNDKKDFTIDDVIRSPYQYIKSDIFKSIEWVKNSYGGHTPYYVMKINDKTYTIDIYSEFNAHDFGNIKLNEYLETKN